MNSAGQLGGFVCSVAFDYGVRRFGSYDAPILLIALMVMLSAFLFWRIDPTRPLVEDPLLSGTAPVFRKPGLSEQSKARKSVLQPSEAAT